MSSKNEHTGDNITSKKPSQAFDEGYERIFGKKTKVRGPVEEAADCKPAISEFDSHTHFQN